jgi:hypothetical protein
MSSQPTPCRLGTGATLLWLVLTATSTWAGKPDGFDPEYVPFLPEVVASPVPELCFAPGTPAAEVTEAVRRLERFAEANSLSPRSAFLKHRIAVSWSYTATDGGGLYQGDPITLTWSVVPDGTAIPNGIGEGSGTSNLRAYLDGLYGSEATWMALFQEVFNRWGELSGITYVYEPNDDGSQMFYNNGQIGVRGDIRIGGKAIDGNYGVLAYNYYPNNGDMVVETFDSFYSNTSSNSLGFRNVIAHEHGHGLGFNHVCPVNQTKLMEPYVSKNFDGPQHDDILAANRNYGDRFEHDETPGTAADLGSFGSTTKASLSVDDNTDVDVYSFLVDAAGEVNVTVAPTGLTYLEGPQNGDASCTAGSSYDTLRIQDLEIRVLDVDGSTQLAVADSTGVGGTEVLEVSGDSSDAAQLYSLSLTVSPSDQIFTGNFESGDAAEWTTAVP